MKIGRTTKQRIDEIKIDLEKSRQELAMAVVRLEEHAGTKRIARRLKQIVDRLHEWQRV